MDALKGRRVLVLVQGELAQSPRMLNHARELVAAGADVQLVGFAGVALPPDLARSPAISVHAIARLGSARTQSLPRALFIPAAGLRSLWLAIRMAWLLLCALPRAHMILVQNPPALPAALLARITARLRGAALIVDWHNLSSAMLAMRLGETHRLVRAIARLERRLAGQAQANLCVSEAMRRHVEPSARGGACVVLHDRPVRQAVPITDAERAAILRGVEEALGARVGAGEQPAPVVLVSATSWSQDEDMIMLLSALAALKRSDADRQGARPLVLIATGLGPGRAAFEARAREIEGPGLRIVTGWLGDDLYRDLLRAADLGISMHRSASGLDLPMKIVDMIETRLPVLAYDYAPCLGELLPRGRAAGLFTTPAELAERIETLLLDELGGLARARAGMADLATPSWAEEWRRVALPVLIGMNFP
ncbi:MAG TPA: glycosyltransferase [Stellaceae bacterium]|nr:glycosyltransferase [Stellaceae bacterium]